MFDESRCPAVFVALLLVALALVLLTPFINKPFHIDDPLFIWTAKHILSHPFDPYGFKVNWYLSSMSMSEVSKNPPLTSYYIAFIAMLFGFGEAALHTAFLLPAVAAILGVYYIAKRFCKMPFIAALSVLATPVFVTSATVVMCDIMALAFWMWSVFFWIEGDEKKDSRRLFLSAALAGLAALTKYYAIGLLLLLPLYSFFSQRRLGSRIFFIFIPLLTLCLYQWWTYRLYGSGFLSSAYLYAAERHYGLQGIFKNLLKGLAFTGGCLSPGFFYLLFLWRKKALIAASILFVAVLFITAAIWTMTYSQESIYYFRRLYQMLHLVFFAALGINILALCFWDILRSRDAKSAFLFVWAAGAFIFTTFVNWTVNARSILFMAAPASVFLARRLEFRLQGKRAGIYIPLILSAALGLLVARADYDFANSARAAARGLKEAYREKAPSVWFQGHWGFQYYMQDAGFKIFDIDAPLFKDNDIIVIPENNCNKYPLPLASKLNLCDIIELPHQGLFTTMSIYSGAAFFGAQSIPYAIGPVPSERYYIIRIGLEQPLAVPVPEYRKRTVSDMYNAMAFKRCAKVYFNKGEYDKAAAEYSKALASNIYDFGTFKRRALCYVKKGEYDKAIYDWTQAIIIYPYDPQVYKARGDLYLLKGEYRNAILDYKQAMRINR